MKAIVVHQYGGPEVMDFEDFPDPIPGKGEVLLRVAASSVNPIDYKRRAGLTQQFYPIKFPGRIGVVGAPQNAEVFPSVKVVPVYSTPNAKVLQFRAEAVRDGKLAILISRKFPLSNAAEAHAAAEKGGAANSYWWSDLLAW